MRSRRAGKVSATVKIEKHGIAGRWAFEAFAGDTAEVRGRNSDCGRNFAGIEAKDFARDAIAPHTFQTALDAPLHYPD
jgi:NADPH-dependent ferric siderophore reductase